VRGWANRRFELLWIVFYTDRSREEEVCTGHRRKCQEARALLLNERMCNKKHQLRSSNIRQHLQSLNPHRTNGLKLDTLFNVSRSRI
jgi:hypothetical protein